MSSPALSEGVCSCRPVGEGCQGRGACGHTGRCCATAALHAGCPFFPVPRKPLLHCQCSGVCLRVRALNVGHFRAVPDHTRSPYILTFHYLHPSYLSTFNLKSPFIPPRPSLGPSARAAPRSPGLLQCSRRSGPPCPPATPPPPPPRPPHSTSSALQAK